MLRAARRTFFSVVGIVLGSSMAAAACLDTDPQESPKDAGGDVPFIDARPREIVPSIPPPDAEVDPSDDASVVIDRAPPSRVEDLVATAATHASVVLTWTAPADPPAGGASVYELRSSRTPITTLAEFLAASPVTAPTPLAAGSPQSISVSGLLPATEYHFAIRARDAAGNFGLPSNDASVSTKPRASFLVSEIAPANTAAEGDDFVELVAVTGGSAAGLEVRYTTGSSGSALLHQFAQFDVAAGERVVIHTMGLPARAGFAQEDGAKDKAASTEPTASLAAYDVYSAATNLLGTSSVIGIMDGASYQDAVAYSDRNGVNANAMVMGAFAALHAANAWTFSSPPVDGSDDCAALLDVVNANASSSPPTCGGYPGFLSAGLSLQRNGLTDTNTRLDFSVGQQTPGAENVAYCAPEGAALALTEVNPSADLIELTATQGGSLRGFSVRRDPRLSATFGTLLGNMPAICVATGDVVVLHVNAPEGSVSETSSKNELAAANHAGYFDGAWDVVHTTGASSLPYASSLVIAVRSPKGEYIEGAAFSSHTVTPPDAGAYHQSLAYLQSLGLWSPSDCGGASCTNVSSPTARDVAASWNGVGAISSEPSCTRSSTTSPRAAASWSVGASSFGF